MSILPEVPWLRETPRTRRFLVGVSGGADSVALLHLLVEAGFKNLVVCHLNHRLREEASGDVRFVENLAGSLGLRHLTGEDDVAARAGSMEAAGRVARHAFFARCAREFRCPRVLLAHHADDRAETVLWNLLRGSHGAKGMRVSRTITADGRTLELIRPLLGVRRGELRSYLQQRNLEWREDATNAEPIAIRNRLRLEAMPLLAEITGRDVAAALGRAAEAGEDHEEIVAWALDQAAVVDPQGRLHVPVLRKLPPALQRAALFRFLAEQGTGDLGRDLLAQAVALLDPGADAACVNLPGGRFLRRRAGRMLVE